MKKIIALALALTMSAVLFAGCKTKEQVVINSAEELNGLTIGCQGGTTGETWVLENCTKKKPNPYKSGMDAALDLKNGKIDAIVLDELPAKSIVEKNSDLKILDIKFSKEEYAIAVKKGNKELVDSINATIKSMKDDGSYKTLTDSFMPADGKIVIPADVATSGSKQLKMGTNAEFPPFEYVEGNKVVGFDITMSQYAAANFDGKLEVINMAFDSLISALQAGTVDFVAAGMSVTEERQKNVDFSDPYYESEQVIIVRK
ncbi:MAG: transporter substrate-binding domain-containing protein [Oscillospiraceae bacterium]